MSRPYLLTKPDGTKQWFLNNKLHRLDGPAVETPEGSRCWYYRGLNHRVNGPAIEYADGSRVWFYYGALHRLDGPAIYYTEIFGDNHYGWYINGNKMSEEKFNKVMSICKKVIIKFKTALRRKYISVLKETNTCDEVFLYNIISAYMI